MKVIAKIFNRYTDKFGVPRQSGLAPLEVSEIVFEKEYRNDDALRGIEEYSHLWIIWQFSKNKDDLWRPTVRPPRLGGNKRVGVFATRSPYRPNAIGLSSVKLLSVEKTKDRGTILKVGGADMVSGTPIIDIKPYIKYTDSHPNAVCSFADEYEDYSVNVFFETDVSQEIKKEITEILKNDPRPAYHNNKDRIYGLDIGEFEIKFKADNKNLYVTDIKQKGR